MNSFKAESLRKADKTLQDMSESSTEGKILTTEFKDRFLEVVATSHAFTGAQSQQDAESAIIEGFERELTQMNVPTNLHATLRRNFILTFISEN